MSLSEQRIAEPAAGCDVRVRQHIARAPLSVVILAFNEEENLPACLASIIDWVDQVFVVDSGSTDATVSIAEHHGATVAIHPFETHARQWNWALTQLPLRHDWILGLDADQRVMPELAQEIKKLLSTGPQLLGEFEGAYINRRQIFRGHWIRWGGYYPKYLLKLFRRDRVRVDERDLMDHHFYVSGKTLKLRHDLIEDNQKERDIVFWIQKHNRYAALHAAEERYRRRNPSAWPINGRLFGTPDQRVVWLKQRWYRLPLYLRPPAYFFYRYVLRLGFLDGKQGFLFHFLQAFWYRLLIDVHLDEQSAETQTR